MDDNNKKTNIPLNLNIDDFMPKKSSSKEESIPTSEPQSDNQIIETLSFQSLNPFL